ncbi:MAG TPA: AI-2E family transporter [Candidatus Omnitrophota bacterium]|nr:AI-2E family transporter [Candidatus Omnitrophota bacterium]
MEKDVGNLIIVAVSIAFVVLCFLLLKPILMSIIFGFVLVFIFAPIYNLIHKKIKSKNLCAAIVTIILILVIVVLLILLVPIVLQESISIFTNAQNIDFVPGIENLLKSFSNAQAIAIQVDSVLHSFVTETSTSLLNSVTGFLKDFPIFLLQLTVVFFTFFFVIRDKEDFIEYIKSILPFSKEVQERLLKATGDVTASVIYGHTIIGILQGIVVGIGFFLFGVSNPLLFTILAIVAGILPILGVFIVWVPMAVYLLITGNTVAVIGVTIFGVAASTVDNFLRPVIIAKRLSMNSLLALLGTIGGILLFGALGIILGPLIIAYLLIFLEVYRNKKFTGLLVKS